MSELTHRKHSGHFESMGLWGELTHGETMTCVHCQRAWVLEKGSGKQRGHCMKCMGYHCGGPNCWVCIPIERRMENLEAGRPELTPPPVIVAIPELPPNLFGG